MADTKPITTTEFATKETKSIEVGGGNPSPASSSEADQEKAQKITVKALRTFHKEEGMKGDMVHPGDTFECTRDRASQLRANGLIEYQDASVAKDIHGSETAEKIQKRADLDAESRQIPKNSRTTPLRNPELKMAPAPTDKSDDK